jgi:hypothetical protein
MGLERYRGSDPSRPKLNIQGDGGWASDSSYDIPQGALPQVSTGGAVWYLEGWKLHVSVLLGMRGCVLGLVENRRLLEGGRPSLLGVLVGVVGGGMKLVGLRLRRFCFFHTWCEDWLEVVLPPKLQAPTKAGCSSGTTHRSSL